MDLIHIFPTWEITYAKILRKYVFHSCLYAFFEDKKIKFSEEIIFLIYYIKYQVPKYSLNVCILLSIFTIV